MITPRPIHIKKAMLREREVDIYIKGNTIHRIIEHEASRQTRFDTASAVTIEARGMTVYPAFYNMHTHAAMTLLRGYADDMPLHEWLQQHIWPAEAAFTPEHIRTGVKLACLEMIKSGTIYFNDMYWREDIALPVVRNMGLRGTLGVVLTDMQTPEDREKSFEQIETFENAATNPVTLSVAPHAIYTAGKELLQRCAETARRKHLKLHIHLSETRQEVEECLKKHRCTPVSYLNKIGFLGSDVTAAHAVHVTDEDIRILAECGVTIAHCPASNMKLSSGMAPVQKMLEAGCRVTIGTDGCSSNNNLDMREEMKIAALAAKVTSGPGALPVGQIMHMATRAGAEAAGIDAGIIEEGRIADLLLVHNEAPTMIPAYNPVSNWVYSADTSLVDTVICNGRILMQGRKIDGEAAILEEAKELSAHMARIRR